MRSVKEVSPDIGSAFAGSPKSTKFALAFADTFALVFSALTATAAHWLYTGGERNLFAIWQGRTAEPTIVIFLGLVATSIAWAWMLGHYTRRRPFWDEVREILHILMIASVANGALLYLGKLDFSRFWFLGTWALAVLLVPLFRYLVKRVLLMLGKWNVPTVIIGTGPNALAAADALRSEPLMGFHIAAFIGLREPPHPERLPVDVPTIVLQRNDLAADIRRRFGAASVVLALEPDEINSLQSVVAHLHREFPSLSIVPALKGLPLYGADINHFFRHEALFLQIRNNLGRRAPRVIKRLFDLIGSSFLLILLSPLFIYIAISVRRSGRQIFFGHTRIGRSGQPFECYKFRTMVPDAKARLEELLANSPEARSEWERDFKLKNDPRITKIGGFLRSTSLDELPQLWNVFMGEMSLVGPRPVVSEELERYGESVHYYLETRPGMTGLWQISGRNDTDYSNRVYLDSWYVKNWSLWYDVVILLKTIRVVLQKSGAY